MRSLIQDPGEHKCWRATKPHTDAKVVVDLRLNRKGVINSDMLPRVQCTENGNRVIGFNNSMSILPQMASVKGVSLSSQRSWAFVCFTPKHAIKNPTRNSFTKPADGFTLGGLLKLLTILFVKDSLRKHFRGSEQKHYLATRNRHIFSWLKEAYLRDVIFQVLVIWFY